VACVAPLDRVIVPNVSLTPDAVTDPITGGHFCAHAPLQLDVSGVSGVNEYNVNPLALVSTIAPPIFSVFRLPAVAVAGLLPPGSTPLAETISILGPPGHGTALHIQLPADPMALSTLPRGTA
jgi:hypothetical protein